ncbi:MAG: glycoside hydrolase family 104 protein [Labilithrix sp.]|nr:glycoside hydrolase family 104 protein [Labilithrix sp.]MCW5817529.1 glycoside hydrolase family 104 protein [Labilithrix sp.]
MKTSITIVALTALLLAACATESDDDEDVGTTADELTAPTCAPSGAAGAVPAKHRAMLDTIAFTEGTAGSCGQDGYNTGFSYKCFSSCAKHPNIVWSAGGYRSSAAGRYQFLNTTWAGLGLGSFTPKNQDIGGMKLVARRGVKLPTDRALTATEFSNAMKKLSYEWASLPFSPYGQPVKTLAATRAKYCGFANCAASAAACVAGSDYCGGNKVTGDKDTLYKCTSGTTGTVVEKCANGCKINPGDDDSCK